MMLYIRTTTKRAERLLKQPPALTTRNLVLRGHVMAPDQSTSAPAPVQYRDIPGFPGYRVGDDGSVWSLWKQVGIGGGGVRSVVGDTWHELSRQCRGKPPKNRPTVWLCNGGEVYRRQVSRLVLLAFVGPCPEGMECRHFPDRDPQNNRLDNLRWDTLSANKADRKVHGTTPRGEKNARSRLTEADVLFIRARYASGGESQLALATAYGVCPSTISSLILRRTWTHI